MFIGFYLKVGENGVECQTSNLPAQGDITAPAGIAGAGGSSTNNDSELNGDLKSRLLVWYSDNSVRSIYTRI